MNVYYSIFINSRCAAIESGHVPRDLSFAAATVGVAFWYALEHV